MTDDTANDSATDVGACALVICPDGTTGTGYLVDRNLLATCWHVVERVLPGERIEVRFAWGSTWASIERDRRGADAVILRLDQPVLTSPLRLRVERARGGRFHAHGFPAVAGQGGQPHGVTITGEVAEPKVLDPDDRPAIQLCTAHTDRAHGLSGAPVIVQGTVIGHITSNLLAARGAPAVLGVLYGCPASEVLALLDEIVQDSFDETQTAIQPPGLLYASGGIGYVHRPLAEARALRYLVQRRPVVLLGPEHCGKTVFLGYILEDMERRWPGLRVIRVNLAAVEAFPVDQRADVEVFLRWLVEHFHPVGPDVALRTLGTWVDRLDAFVKDYLVRTEHGHVVFVVEQLAVLHQHSELEHLKDGLLFLMRVWSQRTHEGPWSRLALILELSTKTALMSESLQGSPFNHPSIDVTDFTLAEAMSLARYHDLKWTEDEVRRLMLHIGGHPFLLRWAMYEALDQGLHFEDVCRDAEGAGGIFAWYLEQLFFRLLPHERLVNALVWVFHNRGKLVDLEAAERLTAAGIIEDGEGGHRFRYTIYEVYLKRRLAGRFGGK